MKQFILSILLVLTSLMSLAQYDVSGDGKDKETKKKKLNPFELKERIYVGSGINVLLGNTSFFYLSPLVGYEIVPTWSAGVSTMFQYFKQGNLNQLSTGAGIFTRYRPIEQLILETSFNGYTTTFNGLPEKLKAKSWMIGAGYARPLGAKSYYQVLLQYDLLRDLKVPEPSLISFSKSRLYYKFAFVFYLSNN